MKKYKVEFSDESEQKIIVDAVLSDGEQLTFKLRFDPIITDPKEDLGLSGYLCEKLISALVKDGEKFELPKSSEDKLEN